MKTYKKDNVIATTLGRKHAYVWRNGVVEFGPTIPEGAMPIAYFATKEALDKIQVMCRLSYDNETMLMNGVPEAESDAEAYVAYNKFLDQLKEWGGDNAIKLEEPIDPREVTIQ